MNGFLRLLVINLLIVLFSPRRTPKPPESVEDNPPDYETIISQAEYQNRELPLGPPPTFAETILNENRHANQSTLQIV